MKKYSVLLLTPDYLADDFGVETYMGWVWAEDHIQAIIKARQEVVNGLNNDDRKGCKHDDYKVIAWFHGHIPMGVCWNSDTEYLVLDPPKEAQNG